MGEIADMMIDGTLCEGCGEYLGSEGDGYPRYCSEQCAKNRGQEFDALDEDEDKDEDKDDDASEEILDMDHLLHVAGFTLKMLNDCAKVLKRFNKNKKSKSLIGMTKQLQGFFKSLEEK